MIAKIRLNLLLLLMHWSLTELLLGTASAAIVKDLNHNRINNTSRDKIRIAVLAPADQSYPYALYKILPAILYAVRTLEKDCYTGKKILYGGWENGVEVIYRDTQCSSTYGPLAAFDFFTTHNADVFLGPLCPYVLAPVARYSSIWEIPILTAGGQIDTFNSKQPYYRLLTRMNGSYTQIGLIFVELLQRFHWEVVALLYHDYEDRSKGHSNCYFTLSAVYTALGRKANFHTSFDETKQDNDYNELLTRISRKARIIVMCASSDAVREIMLSAYELGMVDNGEYVFFNVELFTSQNRSRLPWYRADQTETNNMKARIAYQALFKVTDRVPQSQEYLKFSSSVKAIAMNEFGVYDDNQDVNTFVTAFHEAVFLYALALNETISDGFLSSNGTIITRKMWNRTFNGITGNVSIDDNGDRNVDYSLLNMDPNTGNYDVVSNYYGVSQEFIDVPGKKIYWSGGLQQPPPDTPFCGFEGEKCLEDIGSQYAIVSGILSGLLLVLFIVFIIVYRHYKLEAELASMTWKIRYDDIITSTGINNRSGYGSRLSLARTSISSDTLPLVENSKSCQVFARTGLYKGIVVAIKPIDKMRVDITRSLLIELKHMKDLQHNHIVRFIGACLEPPNCCLITEYCPKGSLQDILENDEIKLDWMFRYSLMHDIIKGMSFLHGSEMHSHGNLKSSNCVVDSRFVLKVTDFGLHSLRNCDNDHESYAFWRKKLWTAPELLRSSDLLVKGSQKGDVYSFAIIAHEIVLRCGPFYCGPHIDLTPKEIIGKVCDECMRPLLEDSMAHEEILTMIRKCWSEDANERPDFVSLQSIMRKVNKVNESSNILDNLLSRMEQYANNLESLVQERTSDYLEEKRKAEDLLYQLLPKSVASQLIRGESVRAESYDSVTIYFSDIVGFTTLSAQSTPMQVVDVLNDLYTCFDSTIENFDVYKVETIGDAYMVVSGLPVRNGIRHAREISRMALALLNAVMSFKIRHRPNEQLMLRIGIHSGSCAAGVVGLKMPRYCLFGDTVNTASRMESTGLPLKIHVSQRTKEILDALKEFKMDTRGEIEIKGKGKMTTYWLMGQTSVDDLLFNIK